MAKAKKRTGNLALGLQGLGAAGAGALMVEAGLPYGAIAGLGGLNNLRRLGARAVGMGTLRDPKVKGRYEAYEKIVNENPGMNLSGVNRKLFGDPAAREYLTEGERQLAPHLAPINAKERAINRGFYGTANPSDTAIDALVAKGVPEQERIALELFGDGSTDTIVGRYGTAAGAGAGGGYSAYAQPAQAIPGAQATNIKMRSPTQAEQVAAGMSTASQIREMKAARMGAKDYRNALAAREAEVAMDVADMKLQPALNALNEPGARQGPVMVDALKNDAKYQELAQRDIVPRYADQEPSGFIGEGMFGKVYEAGPGRVQKQIPAVVEFGMGTESDPMRGERAGGGYLYGPKEALAEIENQDLLAKKGLAPRVYDVQMDNDKQYGMRGMNIDMQDIRDQYVMGDDYAEDLLRLANSGRPKDERIALERANRFAIKQQQAEAKAAMAGIDLQDRHPGNYAVHAQMGRPIQLDIGFADQVTGFEKDAAIAQRAVKGMYAAGLEEEADLLDGLFREAVGREDYAGFHDLAQQGASRLMKLKGGVKDYYRVN